MKVGETVFALRPPENTTIFYGEINKILITHDDMIFTIEEKVEPLSSFHPGFRPNMYEEAKLCIREIDVEAVFKCEVDAREYLIKVAKEKIPALKTLIFCLKKLIEQGIKDDKKEKEAIKEFEKIVKDTKFSKLDIRWFYS